jgi:exonuclease SbcC
MLLKKLKLKNIRTYEDGEVEFPSGTILFEGGIGSGKSTLLLAVEFALFGLGNEKGTTLLSLGKSSGEVELNFKTKGEDVLVHRSLSRARKSTLNQGALVPGGVKQEDCWIEYEGRRTSYSPKEMKEAVLKILNYNEPVDPKAKSVIFRYAVYTPQEEMKEILEQAPDQRLQTIRKALRLEEYKVAKDNARTLSKGLASRSKLLMEKTKKLPEIAHEIETLEEEVPDLENEIRMTGEEIFEAEVELNGHKASREELRARLEELTGEAKKEADLRSALLDSARRISQLSSSIGSNREKASGWRKRIDEINACLKKPSMSSEEAERRLAEKNSKLSEYREALGRINHVHSNFATLIDKKVCPTCNQRVDTDEFRVKLEEVKEELDTFNLNKGIVERDIRELEAEKQLAKMYESVNNEISALHDRVFDIEEQIAKDEVELKTTEGQKGELERKAGEAAQAAADYKAVKVDFDRNERETDQLERKLEGLRAMKSNREGELGKVKVRIEEQGQRRREIEGDRKKAEVLTEYSNWLDEYFSEAMDRIELSILMNANRELDDEFGRWFSFLVDDPTKSVRIDEDFTPLITQDAYEQEVTNLSGGERTALALAYRLALNKTVQRRTGVDSGLLILDEPTDGFSKDQIGKIGDLLKELNLVQAIIVSHERELEGSVDHIFRVQKEDGKSKVLPVTV